MSRRVVFYRRVLEYEYVISYNIIDTLKNGKAVSTAIEQQQLADDLAVAIETLSELNMSSEIENQRCIIDIVQRCTTSVQYICLLQTS